MPLNELSLRFGPAPSTRSRALGIAFVASPAMRPDLSVSAFTTHRFAKENHPQIREYAWQTGRGSRKFKVRHVFAGSTVAGQTSGAGSWDIQDASYEADTDGSVYTLSFDDSPITTTGLLQSPAGSWALGVLPGVVYRSYTIPDYEQSDVWFRTGSLASVCTPGTQVLLVYSVPEAMYGTLEDTTDGRFPGAGYKARLMRAPAGASGPNQIRFDADVLSLRKIVVNGVVRYSGDFTGDVASEGAIKELNRSLRYVDVRFPVSPDDEIQIEYTEYAQLYRYRGYRDRNGVYYPFDANPEYGHAIGDSRYGVLRSASDCLLEQVTVYAIPSAIGVYTIDQSSAAATLTLTFYSAYDFGETHFVRHLVGTPVEDISPRTSEGPVNTYGFAVFGRNYYDEPSSPRRDVYSRTVPSMLPLSRVLLKAPASVRAVAVADARIRGGGVPEDADLEMMLTEPTAGTTLRGFYDLGNWDGKMAQVGGIVEVRVDPSVLQPTGRFTEEQVRQIVASRIPPGVDYELVFETV